MRLPAILGVVVLASIAQAQAPTPASAAPPGSAAAVLAKDVIFGIKAGVASPATVWINNETSSDIDANYDVIGFVDYRLAPKLFGGLALHVAGLTGENDHDPLRDISLQLKALVGGTSPNAQFAFRPGFGLGYGSDGESTYMVIHAFLEVIPVKALRPWVFEIGMHVAPVGGNSDIDVTITPRATVRLGLLF